ncbi:putative ABC transporter ATP-binding protein YheS [Clostridiales bacterium]|nr:putative ABC transporter ATP-binding protein YheS [Clostridiales bacterium]
MAQINVNNLTFAYDGSFDTVFENVSFQIDTDWKIGLIGRNGRGKTTLLHLLMGKYPYRGTITRSALFDYFPYSVSDDLPDTLAVLETVTDAPTWQIQREISYLDVPEEALHRSFHTLSSGEQTKVLLAALFLNEDRFLLIDEPTNHLDAQARQTVGAYLRRKKGFILVSHDRTLLDQCVDHVLAINKTNIEIQKGNFTSWKENKERQDSFQYSENEKLKRQIRDLSDAQKRTARWADQTEKSKFSSQKSGLSPDRGYIGHKAAKMMKRSKAAEARMEKAIAEKSSLLKNIETAEDLKLYPLTHHRNCLAYVRALSISYGNYPVCSDVNFEIHVGERVALQGKNGSGKSSIMKLLLGMEIPFTGEVHMESGLHVSYVPQSTESVQGNMKTFIQRNNIDETLFKAILRKLDFARYHFEKELDCLSAGQKKKF